MSLAPYIWMVPVAEKQKLKYVFDCQYLDIIAVQRLIPYKLFFIDCHIFMKHISKCEIN